MCISIAQDWPYNIILYCNYVNLPAFFVFVNIIFSSHQDAYIIIQFELKPRVVHAYKISNDSFISPWRKKNYHTAPDESLPPQSKNMPSERALAVAYLQSNVVGCWNEDCWNNTGISIFVIVFQLETHILAEGLSPSGLSLCHAYGFWAVSKAQASESTLLPANNKWLNPQDQENKSSSIFSG